MRVLSSFATCKVGLFNSNARPFGALGVSLPVCLCVGDADFFFFNIKSRVTSANFQVT